MQERALRAGVDVEAPFPPSFGEKGRTMHARLFRETPTFLRRGLGIPMQRPLGEQLALPYARLEPEKTALYVAVREHLETRGAPLVAHGLAGRRPRL